MGHPIDVFEIGDRLVLIDSDIRGRYFIRCATLGFQNAVLLAGRSGKYFFDDPSWTSLTARTVRFSSYDAAVIFLNMFDKDLLVDLSHSDASIK